MYNPAKHHRHSIRLKEYDYSQAGLYFITLCCQDRAHLFGEIVDGKMILNGYGQIAHNEWANTPHIRPNVELGEFVRMPNHMHGIIEIRCRGELHLPPLHSHENTNESITGELHSPQSHSHENNGGEYIGGESISPLRGPSQTIGAIVRGYKSSVTKQLNAMNVGCSVWQRNYYEHIVRDEKSHTKISEYIMNNPFTWDKDSLK